MRLLDYVATSGLTPVTAAVALAASCATGLPTQATRVVVPEPGRTVELNVGEQIRIDAPNRTLRWSLTGGDSVVTIEAVPDERPAHWIMTGRQPGNGEIALEGAPDSSTPSPGPPPPAPPRISFQIRVAAER